MIGKLMKAIQDKKAPVVVGLDPSPSFIPGFLMKEAGEKCPAGASELETAAEAVWLFNRAIVDAVADLVPAVKPQSAMYEQFGIPGLMVYERTVRYCHEKGLIVIADVKRGDIGSTSEAYAAAHLGKIRIGEARVPVFDADFATVNPYLGTDGIAPFLKVMAEEDKGIFVLVKTSNKSSGEFQDQLMADGKRLYEKVGEKVSEWGLSSMEGNYSNVGAVVGATYPEEAAILRKQMPHTFILAPGYGAQGASARDLKPFFDSRKEGVIVNSSRGIIAAWKKEQYGRFGETGFAEAARQAAADMIDDLRKEVEL